MSSHCNLGARGKGPLNGCYCRFVAELAEGFGGFEGIATNGVLWSGWLRAVAHCKRILGRITVRGADVCSDPVFALWPEDVTTGVPGIDALQSVTRYFRKSSTQRLLTVVTISLGVLQYVAGQESFVYFAFSAKANLLQGTNFDIARP